MDGFQTEMFSSLKSYGLSNSQLSYGHDILKALKYNSENGLNKKELYRVLGNNKEKTIDKVIDIMNGKLIVYDPKKSHGRETRYFITKAGLELIDKYYDI